MSLSGWKKELLVACVAALVLAALLGLRLFPQPVVGIADNGDFDRLLCPLGMGHPEELEWAHKYFYWINGTYEFGRERDNCMRYATSETHLVNAAIFLGRALFGQGETFDIRVMGLVHCVLFIAAILLILLATRHWRMASRALLFYMLILVLADIGYAVYMNSFFCEPATLLFFLTTAGCFLLLTSSPDGIGKQAPSQHLATLLPAVGFVGSCMLFAASKPQNYVLGMTCLLPCAWLLIARKTSGLKTVAAAGLILIPVYSGSLFSQVDREFTRMQLYDIVFKDVVNHSPTPEENLEELGLPAEFKEYLDTQAWQEGSPYAYPEFREEFQHITYGSVMKLYLRHPALLLGDMQRSARFTLDVRLWKEEVPLWKGRELRGKIRFGHYEPASGKPAKAQSSSWSLWSQFRENVFPDRLWFLLLFGIANLVAVGVKWRKFDRTHFDRGVTVLHLWIIVLFALAFGSVTAGGGSFAVRHMFLVNLAFDSCCILLVMYLLGWLAGRSEQAAEPEAAAEPGKV